MCSKPRPLPTWCAYDSHVRRALISLLWIAACYEPAIPTNVPCSATGACPGDQACINGFCTFSSSAVPDAAVGIADRDRDGIADDRDNCPDLANPDQTNEDGDKFGDGCDVCPQIADNAAVDSDGDRVGDACDPNPGLHDTVWLYDGFHAGLPAWSRTDHWVAVSDTVQASSAGNAQTDGEYLVAPIKQSPPDNFSVTMTVLASQLTGSMGDHSVGIEIFDNANNVQKGVDCALDQGNGGANSILYLGDDFTNGLNKSTSFAWTAGTQYRLTMTRHGSTYTCSVAGLGQTLSGTSAVVPRDGNAIDIWAYGAVAQYGSVQVIGTP